MFLEKIEDALNVNCEKNVTIGAEMEIYIIDAYEDRYELLNNESILENIYSEFDERVYRDYYSYQLEIRTNPSDDWREVAKELIELMKEVRKVAEGQQCIIAPVSYISDGMFNGFHVHISYKPEMSFGNMVKLMLAMYPFMLDITRITLSAPMRRSRYGEILSLRQLESPHIGVPPLQYSDIDFEDYWVFDENARAENRYHDIIINTNRKHGRHRIKNTDTIEIRMFDCVGRSNAIECVLEAVYKIAKYINPEWFEKYRRNELVMMKVRELINNSKIMLVNPDRWLNPITLIRLDDLLGYLNTEQYYTNSWIYYTYFDAFGITEPTYHIKQKYPI